MRKAGLTQRSFAKMNGISQGLVQKWLKSESAPAPEDANKLAVSLGLEGDDRDSLLDMVIAAHLRGALLDRYLGILRHLKANEAAIKTGQREREGLARTIEGLNARILSLETKRKA